MNTNKENGYAIETLISIFTFEDGKIKILLTRKKEDPYKGYWILPGDILKKDETLEDNITESIYTKLGLSTLYIEQCHTFSNVNRVQENRLIAVSFIGIINNIILKLKREQRELIETEWFDIDALPKLGYDHNQIIDKTKEQLKSKITNVNILKHLFPSDFTLPELQKLFEKLLDITIDRRNFRKKLINLELIEDTGYKNDGFTGRPAKLYKFKEFNKIPSITKEELNSIK